MEQIESTKLLKNAIVHNMYSCKKEYNFALNYPINFIINILITKYNADVIKNQYISSYWFSNDLDLNLYYLDVNCAGTEFKFFKNIKTVEDILQIKKCFDVFDLKFNQKSFDDLKIIRRMFEQNTKNLEEYLEKTKLNIKTIDNIYEKFNLIFD